MEPGEQTTGTHDEHYNLVSVLYHALHGAENCETYALDAEAAGREDLAGFFREAQAEQTRLAEQAKGLLGIEDATTAGGATVASEVTTGGATAGTDVPPEEIPQTTDVPRTPPRGTPGDIERGSSPEPAPPGGEAPGSVRAPGDVPPGEERPGEERPPEPPQR
jgi:hypothetical protein